MCNNFFIILAIAHAVSNSSIRGIMPNVQLIVYAIFLLMRTLEETVSGERLQRLTSFGKVLDFSLLWQVRIVFYFRVDICGEHERIVNYQVVFAN